MFKISEKLIFHWMMTCFLGFSAFLSKTFCWKLTRVPLPSPAEQLLYSGADIFGIFPSIAPLHSTPLHSRPGQATITPTGPGCFSPVDAGQRTLKQVGCCLVSSLASQNVFRAAKVHEPTQASTSGTVRTQRTHRDRSEHPWVCSRARQGGERGLTEHVVVGRLHQPDCSGHHST